MSSLVGFSTPPLPTILRSEQQRAKTNYIPRSDDEKKMVHYCSEVVDDMVDYALAWRVEGQDAIEGYMATTVSAMVGRENRSNYRAPIVHSVVYARNAVEAATSPRVKIKAKMKKNQKKAEYMNCCIKSSEMGNGNISPPADHLFFEQTFDKNLLGVGAMYTDYWFGTRLVMVRDDHGRWKEKTEILHDGIYEQVLDPFSFCVSRDTKAGGFGGSAQSADFFYERNAFFTKFKDNPYFFNVDPSMIPDGDWYYGDTNIRGSVRHSTISRQGEVRVRYVWLVGMDRMVVLANGIPIRLDYILNYGNPNCPRKFGPITTIHNDYNYESSAPDLAFTNQQNRYYQQAGSHSTNKSFWSKGDAKLVKPMTAVKNTFGRVAIDYLKSSGVHLVVGPQGVIDRLKRGRLYGIEPIRAETGQDVMVKSLGANSQFFSEYKLADDHFDMVMSFALGRDWKRVGMEQSNERATIAAIRQEVERRRDAQGMHFNETGGIYLRYWIKTKLIEQYYAHPNEIDITLDGQIESVDEDDIVRDPDGRPIRIKLRKQIPYDKELVEARIVNKKKIEVINDKGEKSMMEQSVVSYELVSPKSTKGKEAISKGASPMKGFKARASHILINDEEPELSIEPLSSFEKNRAMESAITVELAQTLSPYLTMTFDGKPLINKEGAEYLVKYIVGKMGDGAFSSDKLLGKEQGKMQPDIMPPPLALSGLQDSLSPMISGGMGGAPPVEQTNPSGTPAASRSMGQASGIMNGLTP